MEKNNGSAPDNRLTQLLAKHMLTEEEKKWLLDYLENTGSEELQAILQQPFAKGMQNEENAALYDPAEILQLIHKKAGIASPGKKALIIRFRKHGLVAASVISFLLLLAYFLSPGDPQQQIARVNNTENSKTHQDMPPGASKATLLLDDGSNVVLDDAENGILARQGNVNILKSGEKINYLSINAKTGNTAYNTISTPRGGQYAVELSDGTKVWLNAASSIRFPAFFGTGERVVEITGEVYFEVASLVKTGSKDKIPFIVKINPASGNGGEVNVLGTHFNIMAYPEEHEVQTTLLEGSVIYNNKGSSKKLAPGQQAVFSSQEGVKVRDDVKVNDVIAWKNGFFHFEGCELEVLLRQLCRWYDADVIFKRKINDRFYADIPMNTMLSDALKALELTDVVHFTIENGKIIVN
ncbi:MAG: FecR domain-containing protein [Agriterribacter sp.]